MAHNASPPLPAHVSPSSSHPLWLGASQLLSVPWTCHILSYIETFISTLRSAGKTLLYPLYFPHSSFGSQFTSHFHQEAFSNHQIRVWSPCLCVHIHIIKHNRLGCHWQFVCNIYCSRNPMWVETCPLLCFYGQICCLAHRGNSINVC